MSEMFDDSTFYWGQAGLPGTGITEGEKATISSRLTGVEDDLNDNYYTQSEVDALVAAAKPIVRNGEYSIQTNANSEGDYPITGGTALITYAGLVPAKQYRIAWQCDFGVWRNATPTGGRFGVRIVHGGGTSWRRYITQRDIGDGNVHLGQGGSFAVTADVNGAITICPGFAWDVGQIRVSWVSITATLSEGN